MRIIPAIDIIEGKCVRLTQGDYEQIKIYDHDPVSVAQEFERKGAKYLHLVDLDGAKASRPKNLITLNSIGIQTSLKIDFGGGIKSENDLMQALASGAEQVNIGSLAVRNPTLVKFWIKKYGWDKIIIGADVKDRKISVGGWKEQTNRQILDFINEYSDHGARYFVCTDISKDGMLEGSALELYNDIIDAFPKIKLIASGGVSTLEEIVDLKRIGCEGVIIGKALYEGILNLEDIFKSVE
jgi:phosphoribosylformimino-5-aminoimidazole carboxamide ribotide isomerase